MKSHIFGVLKFPNFSNSGSRYEGFGNTPDMPPRNDDDLLAGALGSLSVGWNMLSKGASQAANLAKDVGMQATQKASQLTENVVGFLILFLFLSFPNILR